jgi:catechol 2,3-dioxygenase-like lactoylglutathione lyase family enzyme
MQEVGLLKRGFAKTLNPFDFSQQIHPTILKMVSFNTILPTLSLLISGVISAKMGAVGIAVSDMAKSQEFYTKTLGLKPNGMAFNTSEFSEIILTLPGTGTGSALVLMKYKTPKNTANLPVKLVFYVEDMAVTMGKMKEAGAKIVAEPGSLKIRNTTLPTAFVNDPDGYSVELNPLSAFGKMPARMM